jgi:hypothetical protein
MLGLARRVKARLLFASSSEVYVSRHEQNNWGIKLVSF